MADRITYVGLDVHQGKHCRCGGLGGLRARCGNTAGSRTRRRRWTGWLRKLGVDGTTLQFCYEAGPCGYGIQRRLSAQGQQCVVSLLADPKRRRPGQDRPRDAAVWPNSTGQAS